MKDLKGSGVKSKYLLDSNILIDYFRGYPPIVNFLDKLITNVDYIVAISSITEYEIYSGKSLDDQQVKRRVDALIKQVKVLPLSRPLLKFAGELTRYHQLSSGDAIIAATAITYNYLLLTRNRRHLENLPGLKTIIPKTD